MHPTYFECNRTTSAIQGRDDPLVTQWAQARKVKVLARFDCQSAAAIDRSSTTRRPARTRSTGLVGLVSRYGYDGISLDLEAGARATAPR